MVNWFVLIQGRRPLYPLWLEDENDGEYLAVTKTAYRFLVDQRQIPASQIFVLLANRDTDKDEFPEAKEAKMIYNSDPGTLIEILEHKILGDDIQLFIQMVSHGGTDKLGEVWDTVEKNKRGLNWHLQELQQLNRWWIMFPHPDRTPERISQSVSGIDYHTTVKLFTDWDNPRDVEVTPYNLHWQVLLKTLYKLAQSPTIKRIIILGFACYSGGLFQWLPEYSLDINETPVVREKRPLISTSDSKTIFPDQSVEQVRDTLAQLPIYVMSSSDYEYMAGTWFWYEWWNTLKAQWEADVSLEQLYRLLHAKDPTKEFDPAFPQARGERMDSLMVSQFYGQPSLKDLRVSDIFRP